MEILCFFAGIAFFYFKNAYPLYFLISVCFFRPKLRFFLWFLAAIIWGAGHQWLIADQNMPNTSLIATAIVEGYVISIPTHSATRTQFQFLAERLNGRAVQANLLLSCYQDCPAIKSGQHWHLQAKLKKPINLANPGSFDYVSWLSSRHITWVGNTSRHSFHLMGSQKNTYFLLKFREYLSEILYQLDSDETTLGVFEALTLGLTTHIDKEQWDLFRRTGTTHLIDISGEHIALIAGLTYWLLKWCWKYAGNICLRYPAPKIASLGAMVISFLYALIAGFAVPTQRSLITCCVLLLRNFCHHRLSIWQAWRYALLLVLLFEPHSVFMLGFYFSFLAVVILILISQRVKISGIRKTLALQLACMFGLMPLSLYWFSYGSINGLVANLIAIPWVGFIVVPLALIIAFLSPWLVIPGSVAVLKWCIEILLTCLTWIDTCAGFNFNFTFTELLSALSIMIAMAVLLFFPLIRFFPAATLLLIIGFFPNYEKIKMNQARIDVLDVGQGLAVVIRTANHALIYDTGMKFYQANDMGKLAIIPYLNKLHITKLDKVIISHPDLDHRGGLASLEKFYSTEDLIVDDPSFYKHGQSCHHYPAWQWDGVIFQFFPILEHLAHKNNYSCVLQVQTSSGQMLLTGDIEKIAEDYLIAKYKKQLASTVLLIPHHGSKTSSSAAFVEQVAPKYAVASYGFDNRYHFPHHQAMRVYQKRGVILYNTLEHGMIRVDFGENDLRIEGWRR